MPFENGEHITSYRIYYEDTDAGGIVYHANYLRYAERARTDALRELGIHQSQLRAQQGVFFVLRHADITYSAPLILDDEVEVRSGVTEVGNSSLRMRQSLWRDGLEVSRMLMHIVCISESKRPVRIPAAVLEPMQQHMMRKEGA